jgi:hypothetical protein
MLKKLKIRPKMLFAFTLVSMIALIVGSLAIFSLKQLAHSDTVLYQKMTAPLELLAETNTYFQKERVYLTWLMRTMRLKLIIKN